MKIKAIVEATCQYGDVRGNPIDFVRAQKNESITINYDCTQLMTPKNQAPISPDSIDQIKVPHDSLKYDYKDRDEEFLKHSLKKICYELKKDKDGIQDLQLIYLNIDGKEEALLDTTSGSKKLTETVEFEDGEIIESAIIYCKNEFFCGIYITTNKRIVENNEEKQRNILLGVTARENVDGELVIRVNNENKVIIGMGCCANEQYGISAIYLYQVDKVVFSLYQTYGIRQLRAKIKNKNNKEFEESLEKLKPKLNPEQKLLSDVCGLPEAVFFSILKYTMPY